MLELLEWISVILRSSFDMRAFRNVILRRACGIRVHLSDFRNVFNTFAFGGGIL